MARHFVQGELASSSTGVTDAEFWSLQDLALAAAFDARCHPTVAGLPDEARATDWNRDVEFGLQRILDGLRCFAAT